MPKQLSDLRRARGLIQQAYSKIVGRFGTDSETLVLLTEALALIKRADVPGGVIEVEENPASSTAAAGATTPAAQPSTSTVGDGGIRIASSTETAEPPPIETSRKRSTGRKK